MGLITSVLSPGKMKINSMPYTCLARTREIMLRKMGGKLLLSWRRLELQHGLWDDLGNILKVIKAFSNTLMPTLPSLCHRFSVWACQLLLVGVYGAAVAPQVWREKFTSLPFVQKMSIISEWIKNGGILPMLCGVVLWISSPASMKICGVKQILHENEGNHVKGNQVDLHFFFGSYFVKCCAKCFVKCVLKADFASRT